MKPRDFLFSCVGVLVLAIGANSIAAQEWNRIGPAGGDVISLAAAAPDHLYLGMADGHIYASDDGAKRWELRGRVDLRPDTVVQRLVVDSRSARRLFAAVWYQQLSAGGGLFRTEDAGRAWVPAGLRGEAVRVVEQSPSAPETFIAGTRSGVFRSSDDGVSWQRITPVGDQELRNIDSLAFDPRNPQTIYVGTYHLPWKTIDGGKNWTAIPAGMIDDSDVMSLRIDAAHPDRVFASACSGIYRSENGGAQWTKLQGIPYTSRRTQVIVQDPSDASVLYAGTTEGLWVTRDSGENWSRISPRDWVINGVAFAKKSGSEPEQRLILGTEGHGVLVSDDAGRSFVPANDGLSHYVVADLVGDPGDPQHLLARVPGLPGILEETHDAGKTWIPLAGDTPSPIRKILAGAAGWFALLDARGGLAQYDVASKTWKKWKFLVQQNIRAPQRKAKNSGQFRRAMKEMPAQVFDLRFSADKVYAATDHGLWSGSPRDQIFRPSAEKSIVGNVRSLETTADGKELWLLSPAAILHSGDAAVTWSPLPSAMLDSPQWIRRFAGNSEMLFVGTSRGVFVSRNAGQTWDLLQAGLPAFDANPLLAFQDFMIIPLKSGGLYLSRDLAKSWVRLDGPTEMGVFTGIASDGQGGLYAGSRNEGVLHLRSVAWK